MILPLFNLFSAFLNKNVHPVYGDGIWTRDFQNVSSHNHQTRASVHNLVLFMILGPGVSLFLKTQIQS